MAILYKLALFTALITIEFLATTSSNIPMVEHIWDKANHAFAFMVLYILLSLAFKRLNTIQKALLLLIYGIQIEIAQYFIPSRDFSLLDIIADSVGIIIGVITFLFISKYTRLNNIKL